MRACDLVAVKADVKAYVEHLINDYRPHLVDLSCMTFQHSSSLAIAELAKSIDFLWDFLL